MDDVVSYLPKAAFYIMTELPVKDANEFCIWLLRDFRMDGKTIMLAPGDGFYLNQENGRSQVRVAFVLGIPELRVAMDILEAALAEYTKIPTNQKQQSYSYI